jgi:hypothetical protein
MPLCDQRFVGQALASKNGEHALNRVGGHAVADKLALAMIDAFVAEKQPADVACAG